ncbi:MAG: Pyruvate kinase [Syntrophus sp. PtaU1.Bin005]|jgi:pyruvate kinase|uniref:pyruvate kinase n=1 Tax=Syntrophus buswellii TaxID=43774 RepID=UPI0009CEBA5E|nr:MAG: Pyruvate kinase [Syntrophus sp. PtaB.Bin138]OPY78636.1 MAG: Pyruvate kinase [Syntrophus sp. PtaU1.Bin005]
MRLPTHKTKIVCTIGPSSRSEALLERLMLQGMNVARLNFAHGTLQSHREDIQRIQAVAKRLQRHCLIMADLPGPKIRIGKLLEEPLLLEKGDEVVLTVKDLMGTPTQIPVEYKRLPESVTSGDLIFLNDGFIQLLVEKVSGEDVFCRTVIGGPLLSHKGLSIPGAKIVAEAVSDTDLDFVAFALQQGVDAFGVSFAETAEDILKVKRFAQAEGQSVYVVAKIERAEAIENFNGILSAADAIMIARGDLGVQIPLQDVPAVQKKLIHQANRLGRPVITATQMLVSMTENIRPTRAEVSDVANAILDGTDAVMLSEETAIGRYPVEAVELISKIAISAEREKKTIRVLADLPAYFRAAVGSGDATVEDVITLNAVESAGALNVRFILTHTQGRAAPCLISRFRPDCWILAHGGDEKTNNFLGLSYGVHPVQLDGGTTGLADKAVRWLVTAGMVEKDESLVWVEDESPDDRCEALSMKIIKA